MAGYRSKSAELELVRRFVREYLGRRDECPPCERMYQLSRDISESGMSRRCLRIIGKELKVFINEGVQGACSMDGQAVGRYLYELDAHWRRGMDVFGKVFHPMIPAGGKVFGRMSSRLFRRLVRGAGGKIVDFVSQHLKREMSDRQKGDEDGSGRECVEQSTTKKQKLSYGGREGAGKPVGGIGGDEFGALSGEEKVSAVISILRSWGCLEMLLPRIVECLVSLFKSEIEHRKLGMSGVRKFIDGQRNAEYMKDYFYAVESEVMRRMVMEYSDDDIFRMLSREDEMKVWMDFFCISGSEGRLVDALEAYCRRVMEGMSRDDFVAGYYWVNLKLRKVYGWKGDGYQRIRDGVERCKRTIVNSDVTEMVGSVCGWADSLLRGRMCIQESIVSKKKCRVVLPGGGSEELDTGRILEKMGVDGEVLGEEVWREYVLSDVFEVVGEMFRLCESKQGFEAVLQRDLGNRLLSRSSASIEWERLFIDKVDPGKDHLNKMRCMVRDFCEGEATGGDVVPLRAYKWPEYESVCLGIPAAEEVKRKYAEDMVRNKKKRVRWNDLVSSCEVEVMGVPATVSLVQYVMIRLLSAGGRTEEELKICKGWDGSLEMLVRGGMVGVDGGRYSLSLGWKGDGRGNKLIPETFPLAREAKAAKGFDESESRKDLLDCRIVRSMKANRLMSREELRNAVGADYPPETVDERVEALVGREFLCVDGEDIRYLP